jgi:hypothetical protein
MLEDLMLNIHHLTESVPPRREFRCSGFPFCPLRWIADTLDPKKEITRFSSDFYMSVGTTVHLVLQKWMARTQGGLFGNWKCASCQTTVSLSWSPQRCPGCGTAMDYDEVTFTEPTTGLTGHTDGLTRWKKDSDDLMVFDFKTISIERLKNDDLPYWHNIEQVNAYAVLLQRLLGLPIVGFALAYIARDDPRVFRVIKTKKISEQMCDANLERFMIAQKALETKKFKEARKARLCKTEKDLEHQTNCRLRSICANPNMIKEYFRGLI